MKKLLATVLALAMVLSLGVSAFASEQAGPDDVDLQELAANYDGEIKVTVWGTDAVGTDETSRGYLANKMAEEFSALYDNVTVEYVYQGGYDDTAEKVMAAAAGNDLPTMFNTEESMVKGFASIAADIRDYVPSATVEDYQQGLLVSMCGENGELLGAPFARSLPVLYVNPDLLAEAGWSGADIKTNEDMFQCAKDVHDKTGAYGLCCYWDTDVWHWESAIYADGGSVLSEDGSEPTFGADYDYVGAYYLNQIKQGLIEGYVASPYGTPEPADTRDDMFCSGQAAMMLTSCNSMTKRVEKLEEAGYRLETYVQPAGKGGEYGITSGGSNWVLCNTASYEELMFAGAFISYLAQQEQVLRVTEGTGSFMITNSAYESEEGQQILERCPYFQAIYDSIPYLHARPNTPYWTEMYTYAVDKLEQFTLYPEETDVESMIDDISLKFQQIIEDNAW